MEGPMHAVENGILLIVVVAAGTVAARRLRLEPSILLVLVGVILSMIPGVPEFRLDPQIVLVLILPPLLYAAAFQTSLPAFRANLRPILLLAVGLTLFSTVVVGLVATRSSPAWDWRRRWRSAPSWPRPTRSRRPRSRGAPACRAGSSPCWRARACSTTPPPWSPTAWPWPPPSAACSRRRS